MENKNHRNSDHYEDKVLTCQDCGRDFIFTSGEQGFFNSKRPPLAEPKRCKACRDARRRTINPGIGRSDAVERYQSFYDTANNTHKGVQE